MKKLVAAIALTALIASPALAKSKRHHHKHNSALSSYARVQPFQSYPGNVVIGGARMFGVNPGSQIGSRVINDSGYTYTW